MHYDDVSAEQTGCSIPDNLISVIPEPIRRIMQRSTLPPFLSGSRAFGPGISNTDSDYDVICPIFVRRDVIGYLDSIGKNYDPSDYNNGIKVKVRDIGCVNFIFLHMMEYEYWRVGQASFMAMVDAHPIIRVGIKDRHTRHALFQSMVAQAKIAFTMSPPGMIVRPDEGILPQ